MKAVDKRPHYVGLTLLFVFEGNFVLAKVRRVSVVRSWEVSASRKFEMYQFYAKINQGQVSRPLYRGCPFSEGPLLEVLL